MGLTLKSISVKITTSPYFVENTWIEVNCTIYRLFRSLGVNLDWGLILVGGEIFLNDKESGTVFYKQFG